MSPLASPPGLSGVAGRRAPPLRIVWAALRNVRLLFVASKASGPKAEEAQKGVIATSKIAAAIVEVSSCILVLLCVDVALPDQVLSWNVRMVFV